ncbi:lymphocyte antigen 6E-like [Lacerta agilis]|uniref:lymphocyte antigen 6E-like n=1 Tax=Lacerta agilis TaxID=80427 RepID=UPI00141A516E|nr:lymphocyte antigen 6E-like [Lacerta agilis]
MKTSFLVPICVLLLCTNEVHPLVCFTCEQSSSNWSCLKATKCSENDNHCVTTVASFKIGTNQMPQRESECESNSPSGCFGQLALSHSNNAFSFSSPFHSEGFLTVRKRITKKCSPSCPNLNMDIGIGSFGTSCCQSFLCNLFGHVAAKNETR